jgi:hypothetical protein
MSESEIKHDLDVPGLITSDFPQKFAVDFNHHFTIEDSAAIFLYMDCGLWAGSNITVGEGTKKITYPIQRDFGIVYGNWAVLCRFIPPVPMKTPFISGKSEYETRELKPINDLIKTLAGTENHVEVVTALRYTGPSPREELPNEILVFLPDLHIPVLSGMPASFINNQNKTKYYPDGPHMGRHGYCPKNPKPPATGSIESTYDVDGKKYLTENAEEWFEVYNRSDIFQDAAFDLLNFLSRLESHKGRGPAIRLIQLGDMIDLWMGFECFFEKTDDQKVILTNGKPVGGEEFVEYWLKRSLTDQGGNLVGNKNSGALKKLIKFNGLVPIEGNHDCYLKKFTGKNHEFGELRKEAFSDDLLLVEHGHFNDSHNKDGCQTAIVNGQTITSQYVWNYPFLRKVEPYIADVRKDGLDLSVYRWMHLRTENNCNPFAIYVMGHTHVPELSTVVLHDPDVRRENEERDRRAQGAG